jgi:hypothetical protein
MDLPQHRSPNKEKVAPAQPIESKAERIARILKVIKKGDPTIDASGPFYIL